MLPIFLLATRRALAAMPRRLSLLAQERREIDTRKMFTLSLKRLREEAKHIDVAASARLMRETLHFERCFRRCRWRAIGIDFAYQGRFCDG